MNQIKRADATSPVADHRQQKEGARDLGTMHARERAHHMLMLHAHHVFHYVSGCSVVSRFVLDRGPGTVHTYAFRTASTACIRPITTAGAMLV